MTVANNDALCMRILATISAYQRENGFSPTVRELCASLSISSTGEMIYTRDKLLRLGWITHNPRRARTMRLTRNGKRALRESEARP